MHRTTRKLGRAARRATVLIASTAVLGGLAATTAHAAPAGEPRGNFEKVTGTSAGIELKAWALDPDTKNPVTVVVTVDGKAQQIKADAERGDIARAFPGYGAAHGVKKTIPASPGAHEVCLTVTNVGAGANKSLGCRTVTVPGTTAPAAKAAPAAAVTATSAAAASTGRPDAGNTGVPAGTKLTRHNGDLVITKAGTVIDGLDVYGTVSVRADNVVIKNTRIRGKVAAYNTPLVSMNKGNRNLRVIDTTISPDKPSPNLYGIMGWEFTLERVNISKVVDSVHIYGSNVTIKSSWLHSNVHYAKDPNFGGTPTHDDGIQIQKGDNIRILGNRIEDAYNVTVMITQDMGRTSDVQLVGNWLDGAGCNLNIAEKGRGALQGLVAKDNTFGRNTRHQDCAMISPTSTKIAISGNVYTDGAAATVRKG